METLGSGANELATESPLAMRWLRSQRPGPRIGRKHICVSSQIGRPGAPLTLETAVLGGQRRICDKCFLHVPDMAFYRHWWECSNPHRIPFMQFFRSHPPQSSSCAVTLHAMKSEETHQHLLRMVVLEDKSVACAVRHVRVSEQ